MRLNTVTVGLAVLLVANGGHTHTHIHTHTHTHMHTDTHAPTHPELHPHTWSNYLTLPSVGLLYIRSCNV